MLSKKDCVGDSPGAGKAMDSMFTASVLKAAHRAATRRAAEERERISLTTENYNGGAGHEETKNKSCSKAMHGRRSPRGCEKRAASCESMKGS